VFIRFALFLLLISVSAPAHAWGPEGHQFVADIARSRLTATTKRHIRELLGNDDLAAISTWADEVRPQRPETFGWHFVDIPMNAGGFSESRDCYRPDEKHPQAEADHHNCVVDRIEIFQRVLADRNESQASRVEALKFLVHFVADIHQPMHAIREARGGNDIRVTEFGSSKCGTGPCNLHSTWDTGLIEHAIHLGAPPFGPLNYPELLENVIQVRILQSRAQGTPEQWANESFHLAHQVWLNDGGAVDEVYYRKNIGSLDERLALAGLRLAALLNQALGK
jgi:S1/P1 Nuclease